jgi:hypothetical protein
LPAEVDDRLAFARILLTRHFRLFQHNRSKADLPPFDRDVRFAPHCGLKSDIAPCPKNAMNRLMRRSKAKPST